MKRLDYPAEQVGPNKSMVDKIDYRRAVVKFEEVKSYY